MEGFTLRLAIIIACIVFLVAVSRQVAHGKLLLKYSLLWMTLAVASILVALFPGPLFAVSSALGFETPSNFVFFVALFFLLAICLSLSIIASKQALRIKDLVQQEALIEKRLERLEGEDGR
jgi:hypothetical protein